MATIAQVNYMRVFANLLGVSLIDYLNGYCQDILGNRLVEELSIREAHQILDRMKGSYREQGYLVSADNWLGDYLAQRQEINHNDESRGVREISCLHE